MFCKQCGAQIPNGSSFCTSCGLSVSAPKQQPVVQTQAAQPVQNPYTQPQTTDTNAQYTQPVQNPYAQPQTADTNTQYTQPVQNPYAQQSQPFDANVQPVQYAPVKTHMLPERKKKLIIFGAIGGGVLILAILLIVIFSSIGKSPNSSCSAVIDTYVNSAMKGDVDAYMSIMPPDIISYTVENSYYGDYSAFEDAIEETIDLTSLFSSSIQISYEIIDEKHCTDSETLATITEKYCDRYEASSQITDIAKCKIKIYTTYGNIGTPSIDTETMYLIKVGGNWYMDDYSLSSSISSSKFH